MSNTTDMMIVCFNEDSKIFQLCDRSGIQFKKVSDGNLAGGQKVLTIESYGACYKSLGAEKIAEVIADFKNTDFEFPELAVLIIDDDDGNFSGTVQHQLS